MLTDLGQGCSPAQLAGRLKLEQGKTVIGCETIYRFIYAQIKRTNDCRWRHYLPRAKSRRGRHGKKGGSPASLIKDRISIDNRPQAASDRRQPGHWEADLMLFATYGQNILVLHERTSRFTTLVKTQQPTGRAHRPAPRTAAPAPAQTPPPHPHLRQRHRVRRPPQAQHQPRHRHLLLRPSRPWQKGGIENAIGRMRRFLPRTHQPPIPRPGPHPSLILAYNHTPRKCLDFLTPAEHFSQLLHFKRESTFPPSPE